MNLNFAVMIFLTLITFIIAQKFKHLKNAQKVNVINGISIFKCAQGNCYLKESWYNIAKKVINHSIIFNKLRLLKIISFHCRKQNLQQYKNLIRKQNANYGKIYVDTMKNKTYASNPIHKTLYLLCSEKATFPKVFALGPIFSHVLVC